MITVISIVDSVSPTSMPINEFVIYRSLHNYGLKQILIVCDDSNEFNVSIPKNVDVYYVGKSYKKIRKIVKNINENESSIVYHLHHQKSALLFFIATMGMSVRRHSMYTVHSTYSKRNIKYKISSCFCSLMANYANCVSNSAYEEYSPLVKKIKREKFLAITNGVDTYRIEAVINNISEKKNKKELVCVGRMIPLKNHRFLIELIKRLPEYNLVLIGLEDKEKSIREFAMEENVINRVEFLGLLPRNEVFLRLNKARLYVSASYIEGLPISVLEAMFIGLIPIISNIAPHMEIKEKCKNVFTLPFDIDQWVNAIERIDSLSEIQLDSISLDIKINTKKEFSLDKMHTEYISIYNRIK